MRNLLRQLACIVLLCIAPSSYAFNTFFMDRMPVGHMNSEDIDIMLAAAYKALDDLPDGSTSHWENSKTGAGGYLTPRSRYETDGKSCRDMLVENSAGGLTNSLVVSVCKEADGTWKIMRY